MRRGEYRYFNPSNNYKGESPENIRKYTRQDYERMESLNTGNWCYIGVRADASVIFGAPNPKEHATAPRNLPNFCFTPQTITSGGLWGIESDSDKAHIAETEQEQLSELKDQLKALGFSTRAISTAFKTIEREGA